MPHAISQDLWCNHICRVFLFLYSNIFFKKIFNKTKYFRLRWNDKVWMLSCSLFPLSALWVFFEEILDSLEFCRNSFRTIVNNITHRLTHKQHLKLLSEPKKALVNCTSGSWAKMIYCLKIETNVTDFVNLLISLLSSLLRSL